MKRVRSISLLFYCLVIFLGSVFVIASAMRRAPWHEQLVQKGVFPAGLDEQVYIDKMMSYLKALQQHQEELDDLQKQIQENRALTNALARIQAKKAGIGAGRMSLDELVQKRFVPESALQRAGAGAITVPTVLAQLGPERGVKLLEDIGLVGKLLRARQKGKLQEKVKKIRDTRLGLSALPQPGRLDRQLSPSVVPEIDRTPTPLLETPIPIEVGDFKISPSLLPAGSRRGSLDSLERSSLGPSTRLPSEPEHSADLDEMVKEASINGSIPRVRWYRLPISSRVWLLEQGVKVTDPILD